MTLVLAKLPPYQLGRTLCVCKQWQELGKDDALWRPACHEAFRAEHQDVTARLLKRHYRSSNQNSLYLGTLTLRMKDV